MEKTRPRKEGDEFVRSEKKFNKNAVAQESPLFKFQIEKMAGKKYLLYIGIGVLFLVGIPIKIPPKKVSDGEKEILFKDYIRKFNKSYNENDREYIIRFENFKNSLKLIDELNKNRINNQSALFGLTIFSDLSQDEFIKTRLQTNSSKLYRERLKNREVLFYEEEFSPSQSNGHRRFKRSIVLPTKVDWRERGIIGKVHNQKTCGACWAFSTIETVEAMNALKVGSLIELSVQEAVDCAQYGNFGCEGGDSCLLLNWLVSTKTKVTAEKFYPFAYKTETCKSKKTKIGVQVENFTCENYIGKENLMLEKLAFHGPVAAAVNALNWQFYLGGIIQFHCSGSTKNLNHAVQIVGYDTTGPVPYYIVRNSWGAEFGNKGYIYIAIGSNICGLANEVASLDVV